MCRVGDISGIDGHESVTHSGMPAMPKLHVPGAPPNGPLLLYVR
jgi:hypothetical protein